MESNGGEVHHFQSYQEQQQQQQQQEAAHHHHHQQQQQQQFDDDDDDDGGGCSSKDTNNIVSSMISTPSSSMLPWPPLPPIHHHINPVRDHFFPPLPPLPPPPPPPPASFYGDFYARIGSTSSDPLGLAGLYMGHHHHHDPALVRGGGVVSSSSPFLGLHSDVGKMTAQEIMDAKALAASKSHSEAERRRRERINAHLAKLRTLLPSTTKTDKASLLAEVIQHVKELKRQTSEIAEESPLPTESDELSVDAASDEEGRLIVTASLCCDDRADLLPDLIKALKALRLRTLKAEITTLGGRVKNVLVITGDDDAADPNQHQQCVSSIQDALKAVMERTTSVDETTSAGGGIKRQRTANLSTILEHRSI